MNYAAITLAVIGLAASGAATAAERVSDLDYLRASRCKGLAAGLGVSDAQALNEFVKAQGRTRAPYVVDRADSEFDRARREARSEDRRARLTSELNVACANLIGAGVASGGGARDKPSAP
jgi:hypothetical protein